MIFSYKGSNGQTASFWTPRRWPGTWSRRAALAAGVGPDLPVDVLLRREGPAVPPGGPGQPGAREAWRQPPRHQRAERPGTRRGQQPVPAVYASRAYAGQQDHRLDPVRGQACRRQCDSAAVGVSHQHGTLDAARVQLVEYRSGVRGEPGRRPRVGTVSRPVDRDRPERGGQPPGELLPVGSRSWLPVQRTSTGGCSLPGGSATAARAVFMSSARHADRPSATGGTLAIQPKRPARN